MTSVDVIEHVGVARLKMADDMVRKFLSVP